MSPLQTGFPFRLPGVHNHRQVNRGFSLVEVAIGVTLFAIMAVAVFSCLIQTTLLREAAAVEMQATMHAVNEMEYLQTLDWDDLVALESPAPFSTMQQGTRFQTERLIGEPRTGQREIKLIVMWKDPKGNQLTRSMILLLTEYS